MPSSYSLPQLMEKEINALVKAGYYSSKSDVVKDALRAFIESRRNLRIAAAVELYKGGEVTLGKAAEMADLGIIEFKDRLKELGVKRVLVAESASKMDKKISRLQRKYG